MPILGAEQRGVPVLQESPNFANSLGDVGDHKYAGKIIDRGYVCEKARMEDICT